MKGKVGATPRTYLEFLKKGYNMALKIKNREEAIAVLRDMVQRKKEMEKQVQEEFAKIRKEAKKS